MSEDSKINSYKFGETKKAEYLEQLRNGLRRRLAARAVAIDNDTVLAHKRSDPDFALACEQAEMEANEKVEEALFQAALAGNVTAIQVWLYNRDPANWKDKRNIAIGFEAMTDAEIIERLKTHGKEIAQLAIEETKS